MAKNPHSEEDFASRLKADRQKGGLTQADLASRSDLTAAYISQLEGRKKPPPSDEVVERIAKALGAKSKDLMELAHLDKTPKDVRKKVRLLDARLRRQSKFNRILLDDMLPLTLFNFMKNPSVIEKASRSRRIDKDSRDVLSKLKSRIGETESFKDFRRGSREAIKGLKEGERETLVETLQNLAAWEGGPPRNEGQGDADTVKELPVFDSPPPQPAAENADAARGFFPVVASHWKRSSYGIAVADDSMFPRMEKGDLVIIDEGRLARNGDVVAVTLEEGGWMLGRYMKLRDEIEITPANPNHPPRRFPRSRGQSKGYTLRGVAVELIRTLRRG
ncbi:MAG: helix-turn-helix domain-containing protein [Planctomycetota bacterium]